MYGSDSSSALLQFSFPGQDFPDTAILYGSGEVEVKNILVGIDIEVADLLLADRIRQNYGLDLVMSHHPEGAAYARLHEVMIPAESSARTATLMLSMMFSV